MNKFFKYLFLLLFINTYLLSHTNLKKVKLQLSWFNQFQFAAYYIAKEKGYYEQLGLDVEIIPYKMGLNIPSLISNGDIDFAIGREDLILKKANNYNNLVLLYATFQSSPLVFLSKKSSNINEVEDFANKKLMSTMEDASEISLKAMIASQNIDFKDLSFIKHSHNIDDLINNNTQVISAYISKTPYDLKSRGIEYKVFNPKDYGFDMYSDFLYTNNELINEDMQTVENFKKASLKALKYAYLNIDESVDIILNKYNNQNLTKEQLVFEAKELKKLSFYNTNKLGNIDKNKIQRMYDLYKVMGLVKEEINLQNFIFKNTNFIFFTKEEQKYIQKKKTFKICSTPNALPYGKVDKDGIYKGISADFISIVSKRTDIKMEIIPSNEFIDSIVKFKSKECDVIPIIINMKDRNKFMHFTSSYFSQTLVLATKDEQLFINKLKDVDNKIIAVLKDTAFVDILKKIHPNINLLLVNSAKEGLSKVDESKAFAYVDTLVSVAYTIRKNDFYHLKIAGKLEEKVEFSMATRVDDLILNNIIQKALDTINTKEKDDLLKKWTSIYFEKEVDFSIILKIIVSFFIALIVLFIFIYKQNKLKREIEDLNATLEQRVKEEVENNRIKNIALFKQSKLASMGEMIQNIAHQWRQPLNRINLNLSIIKTVYEEENSKEVIKDKIQNAEKNIKYMSQTIDDFMNFFKPDKKKDTFNLFETSSESLRLLDNSILGINININVPKSIEIYNYKNEYIQVLHIILNNAIDNFLITNLKEKAINIDFIDEDNYLKLLIQDNSGGISKENLEKIFEPYFTTKFKKEGTGLGLYMAKILTEESMNGSLKVVSQNTNTTFIIRLRK